MRAVVLQGERSVSTEQVPDPGLPGPDGAVIAVEATAICGSDLHLYHGMAAPGVRLGHEFCGTVVDVGPEVRRLRKGDRVLVSGVIGCGRCRACRGSDPGLCEGGGPYIFGTGPDLPGGQAELAAVPAAELFSLIVPEALRPEQAVLLTDILPTAYLAVERADVGPGATVAVFGAGPVGTLAVECAWLFGAARVLALDTVPERLAGVERLGAEPVDASEGNGAERVLELTGGRGADSVVEAVGSDRTVNDALSCAAPGGTVSVVGVDVNQAMPFPMATALLRRLTFRVTLASIPMTWSRLVPLLQAGRIPTDGIFTHRLGLGEADRAYELFDQRREGVLKVLLDPDR